MALQQASNLSRGLIRTVSRQARPAARPRTWRQVGRRTYASGHGEQQSSELPWIIGSLAVTVPAAGWLLQQGPTKSDHGHDSHHEEHATEKDDTEEKESDDEEKEDQPTADSKDDSEEKGEEKDDDKDDDKEEEKKEDKEEDGKGDAENKEEPEDQDDGSEKNGEDAKEKKGSKDAKDGGNNDDYPPPSPGSPGQINWKPGKGKGPGEGQKGERPAWERKGEKDSQGTSSGAKHPYIDDTEKSKKGNGVTETAKIHGTVDSRQPSK